MNKVHGCARRIRTHDSGTSKILATMTFNSKDILTHQMTTEFAPMPPK